MCILANSIWEKEQDELVGFCLGTPGNAVVKAPDIGTRCRGCARREGRRLMVEPSGLRYRGLRTSLEHVDLGCTHESGLPKSSPSYRYRFNDLELPPGENPEQGNPRKGPGGGGRLAFSALHGGTSERPEREEVN